jgi:hypothetical protein
MLKARIALDRGRRASGSRPQHALLDEVDPPMRLLAKILVVAAVFAGASARAAATVYERASVIVSSNKPFSA